MAGADAVKGEAMEPTKAPVAKGELSQVVSNDDLLLVGDSPQEVQEAVRMTMQVLMHAGFLINLKKSDLNPSQELIYIGALLSPVRAKYFSPWTEETLLSELSCRSAAWEPFTLPTCGCKSWASWPQRFSASQMPGSGCVRYNGM